MGLEFLEHRFINLLSYRFISNAHVSNWKVGQFTHVRFEHTLECKEILFSQKIKSTPTKGHDFMNAGRLMG